MMYPNGFRIASVLALAVMTGGCTPLPGQATPQEDGVTSVKELVFLTREGCVNTATMRGNLDEALKSMGWPSDYQFVDVDTMPEGDARRGYPTPTLLYANKDVFGMTEPTPPYPTPT